MSIGSSLNKALGQTGDVFDKIGAQTTQFVNSSVKNTGNFYERNQNTFASVNSIVSGALGPVTFGITPIVGQAINAGLAVRNAVVNKRKVQQRQAQANQRFVANQKLLVLQNQQNANGQEILAAAYGSTPGSAAAAATGVGGSPKLPNQQPTLGQVITSGKTPILIVTAAIILAVLNAVVTKRR